MAEQPEDLIRELRHFLLSSSKNTEQFSSELLDALNVPTTLDRVLVQSVRDGRDVLVAGTAGSGKTHLLNRLESTVQDMPVVEFGERPPSGRGRFVSVVKDLTALPDQDKLRVFQRVGNCAAVVVCANEGTLLLAAKLEPKGAVERMCRLKLEKAVECLHRIQRGEEVLETDAPVVLDAAGFDPTFGGALDAMVSNTYLAAVVEKHSSCDCDPSACPRRQAWTLLGNEEVRRRLCNLISAAALEAEGFTFRVLWNFVADLALGGKCASRPAPPTSPWFWRVFNGESQVAERLKMEFPLTRIPIPHAENRLWYGDWSWFEEPGRLIEGIDNLPVLPQAKPCDGTTAEQREDLFGWSKSQAVFCLREDPLEGARTTVAAGSLWGAVREGQQVTLIQALNRYMTYGLGTAGSGLELWIDYAMERRLERPSGQVSVGRPGAAEFRIVRSRACGNLADDGPPAMGARLFLRHDPSGASLSLTRETLAIIVGGRSFRMSDRIHTEVDWLLMSFFYEVARKAASSDHLRLALFDFRERSMRQVDWDVIANPPSLTLTTRR